LIGFGPESELDGIGGREGIQEFQFDVDEFARKAFRQRHASFTNLLVANHELIAPVPSGAPS
jgi:hypothetical protein